MMDSWKSSSKKERLLYRINRSLPIILAASISISIDSILGNWKNKQLIMDKLFFDSWDGLLRAFIATVLAYITLLVMIRISGKRTLSKMNAYDFIVTIALGSCLAATALNKSIPLAEGALVYFTLIGLQLTITWSAVRSSKIKRFVSGSPTLLLYKGKFFESCYEDAKNHH